MNIDERGSPVNLDDTAIDLDLLPLSYWYTANDAAAALTRKSKREVNPAYLRSLTRAGAPIRTKKLGPRAMLYLRHDVDKYIVEARGKKASRAQKSRAEQRDGEERK